jgi:hypothetical protein
MDTINNFKDTPNLDIISNLVDTCSRDTINNLDTLSSSRLDIPSKDICKPSSRLQLRFTTPGTMISR